MAEKLSRGIICKKPKGYDYKIEHVVKKKELKLEPTGVFVSGHPSTSYRLEYAGLTGDIQPDGFQLPHDADFLRDIAAALSMAAAEIDEYFKHDD